MRPKQKRVITIGFEIRPRLGADFTRPRILGGVFPDICDTARELHREWERAANDGFSGDAKKIAKLELELDKLWERRRAELRANRAWEEREIKLRLKFRRR